MVRVVQLVFGEELSRMLKDLLKLFEAIAGADTVHNSGLHILNPYTKVTEEFLDQKGSTLSNQIGVDTVDLIDAALVLFIRGIKLCAEFFSHKSNELDLLQFFLENCGVADQLSIVITNNRLAGSWVEFRTGLSLLLKLKLPI